MNGAHRWHNYMKTPNEIKLEEAAVLHYTCSSSILTSGISFKYSNESRSITLLNRDMGHFLVLLAKLGKTSLD